MRLPPSKIENDQPPLKKIEKIEEEKKDPALLPKMYFSLLSKFVRNENSDLDSLFAPPEKFKTESLHTYFYKNLKTRTDNFAKFETPPWEKPLDYTLIRGFYQSSDVLLKSWQIGSSFPPTPKRKSEPGELKREPLPESLISKPGRGIKAWRRDACVMLSLKSDPHILQLNNLGWHKSIQPLFGEEYAIYIITEYVGIRLIDILCDEKKQLPWPQRVEIALKASLGLKNLHLHGIVHRKLSVYTVLLSDDYKSVKLSDFSSSRMIEENSKIKSSDRSFQFEFANDVFNFGIILAKIILWQPHLVNIPESGAVPPGCPPDLLKLMHTCITDKEKLSASQLAQILQSILDSYINEKNRRSQVKMIKNSNSTHLLKLLDAVEEKKFDSQFKPWIYHSLLSKLVTNERSGLDHMFVPKHAIEEISPQTFFYKNLTDHFECCEDFEIPLYANIPSSWYKASYLDDAVLLKTWQVGQGVEIYTKSKPGPNQEHKREIIPKSIFLDDGGFEAWRRDASVMLSLKLDPHILQIKKLHWHSCYDSFLPVNKFYKIAVLTERMGVRLIDLLADEKKSLPWSKRVEIVLKAAKGLRSLHEHGIVYRKFNVYTILLSDDYNEVKLSDFSDSCAIYQDLNVTKTQEAIIKSGDPFYKAPAGDIFNFGCILAKIIEWRPHIIDEDSDEIKITAPDCPSGLLSLLGRCLKSPENLSAHQLTQELKSILDEEIKKESDTFDGLKKSSTTTSSTSSAALPPSFGEISSSISIPSAHSQILVHSGSSSELHSSGIGFFSTPVSGSAGASASSSSQTPSTAYGSSDSPSPSAATSSLTSSSVASPQEENTPRLNIG